MADHPPRWPGLQNWVVDMLEKPHMLDRVYPQYTGKHTPASLQLALGGAQGLARKLAIEEPKSDVWKLSNTMNKSYHLSKVNLLCPAILAVLRVDYPDSSSFKSIRDQLTKEQLDHNMAQNLKVTREFEKKWTKDHVLCLPHPTTHSNKSAALQFMVPDQCNSPLPEPGNKHVGGRYDAMLGLTAVQRRCHCFAQLCSRVHSLSCMQAWLPE